ncbi:MAG: phosphatidylglycerophosphatase A [Bdellovibrionales bacterium]
MTTFITYFATWFGLGRLKPAPGTWGTLGAAPLVLVFVALGPYAYLAMTVGFAAVAMLVAHLYEQTHEGHDRSEVVIDEVAGFLVTMAWLPMTWQSWLLGFALFRVLDALKPPPISWVDRRIPGGVGVVADDLVAGVLANFILQMIYANTAWLGAQLLQ